MKVLFIGATGAVGKQVVPILGADFELTAAALGGGEVADLPVADIDITAWESVRNLVEAGTPNGPFDAIVNCAIADHSALKGNKENRRDPDVLHDYAERCIEVNARGAYHIYEAAARAKVPKVVYISSMTAVFGLPRYEKIDQNAQERPRNVYAACKIFGEHVGRTYALGAESADFKLQVLCLRLGMPYPVFTGSDKAWQNNQGRRGAIVHMEDVAGAIRCALHSEVRFGVYPIVSASDHPYIDAQLYAELGYRPQWMFNGEGLSRLEA